MNDTAALVKQLRNTVIPGVCIDLVPLNETHFARVTALRNRPEVGRYLNQTAPLTVDDQRRWYEETYLPSDDDLYYAIVTKDGRMAGTIRLNDITSRSLAQSSFIMDADMAGEGPYTAETEYLTLCLAFDTLGVDYVINEPRTDNKPMNRLAKKMGFTVEKVIEKDGHALNWCTLTPDRFPRETLRELLAYWAAR